ncbi:MAG: hypothetical protein KAZ26_20015 [Caldilineaceae bacterium]|nr:hypothetical protein [Caldilineaceae bacterium]
MTQPTDAEKSLTVLLEELPQWSSLQIYKVFPGEYRIGYTVEVNGGKYTFIPGTPNYFPLEEAAAHCLDALRYRLQEISKETTP